MEAAVVHSVDVVNSAGMNSTEGMWWNPLWSTHVAATGLLSALSLNLVTVTLIVCVEVIVRVVVKLQFDFEPPGLTYGKPKGGALAGGLGGFDSEPSSTLSNPELGGEMAEIPSGTKPGKPLGIEVLLAETPSETAVVTGCDRLTKESNASPSSSDPGPKIPGRLLGFWTPRRPSLESKAVAGRCGSLCRELSPVGSSSDPNPKIPSAELSSGEAS